MKRVGYLMERVADMENLREAFFKAQRGKSGRREVFAYRRNLESNLFSLNRKLMEGNVEVGNYHLFKVYDPKERTVCAAAFEERVLHHALMNVCAPYFERHFVSSTYANRKDKGVYKALEQAHAAAGKYKYVAKLDVRKYFDSISHVVLKQLLERLFKDRKLLEIMAAIIDSYMVTEGRGVPIGNLTSQYFANYYLSGLDHYAKERLKTSVYVRYMDDILLFGDDVVKLRKQVESVVTYAQEQLLLEMKPPQISQTTECTAFLGYRLVGHRIALTTRSKRRFEKKYAFAEKQLAEGIWSEKMYQAHILPLFAFVKHGYTKRYRKRVIEKVTVVGIQPRESGWQLEQQCLELPCRES